MARSDETDSRMSKEGLERRAVARVCRRHGQCETDEFTPLRLSLQLFGLVENLWCKLDLNKRETTKETRAYCMQQYVLCEGSSSTYYK